MQYTKTEWENLPSTSTPINANNLNKIENQLEALTNAIYPVGSIYISVNNTNPSTIFGGTWERIKGKCLVGVDEDDTDFETASLTGGEKTHTLTTDEMPSHNHRLTFYLPGSGGGAYIPYSAVGSSYVGTDNACVNDTGGNQPHNILQPYFTAYIWVRTA